MKIKALPWSYKGSFTRSDFKNPILGSENCKQVFRRSDFKVPFCGENVGKSFVVCSHDPIFRTNKESSIWRQNDQRDTMQNLSAPFIFQEACRMKIEHVLFPSVSSTLRTVCRTIIFNVFTRSDFRNQQNRILKNGSYERAFTQVSGCSE